MLMGILSLVRVWLYLFFPFKIVPKLLMCLQYLKQNIMLFKHLNKVQLCKSIKSKMNTGTQRLARYDDLDKTSTSGLL